MADKYNQSQIPNNHQAQGFNESMNTPTFVDAADAEVGKTETKDKSLFGFLKKVDHEAESEPENKPAAYDTTDGGVEDESNLSDEEVEEEGGEKKKKRGLRRKIKDLFHGKKAEKKEKNPETEILDKEVEVAHDKPAKNTEASDDQSELNRDIIDGIKEKVPVSKEPKNTEYLHSTLPPIADETHNKEVEVAHAKPTEFTEASADQAELKHDLSDEITEKVPISQGSENTEDNPSTLPPITSETHTKEVEVAHTKPTEFTDASAEQSELKHDLMDEITENVPISEESEYTEDTPSTPPPITGETHTKEVEVSHTKPTEFTEASAEQAQLKHDLMDEITEKVPISEESEYTEDTPSTLSPIKGGETHTKEVEVAHTKPTEFTEASAKQAELKHDLLDEITEKVPISEESENTKDTTSTLPSITGETHTKEFEVAHAKPAEFTEASAEQAELKHDLMDEITEKVPISEESENTKDTPSTLPSITGETHTKEFEVAHAKPTEFTEASAEQAELKHDLMDEITEKVPISEESENTIDTPSTLPSITDETHTKESEVAHSKPTEFTEASADQPELKHGFMDEQTENFEDTPSTQLEPTEHVESSADKAELGKDEIKENLPVSKGPESTTVAPSTPPPITDEPENFEDTPSTQLEPTEHAESSADKAELEKDEIKENLPVSKGPESTTVAPSTPPPITDETHPQEPEKGFFGKMMDSLPGYNTKATEK